MKGKGREQNDEKTIWIHETKGMGQGKKRQMLPALQYAFGCDGGRTCLDSCREVAVARSGMAFLLYRISRVFPWICWWDSIPGKTGFLNLQKLYLTQTVEFTFLC